MKIIQYPNKKGITKEYYDIRNFLINIEDYEYAYARWDWMITHSMTKEEDLSKIGMWIENDHIVGLVIFDIFPDVVYLRTMPEFNDLKKEMLNYVKEHFSVNNCLKIMIQEDDDFLKELAVQQGMKPTDDQEVTSIIYTQDSTFAYQLSNDFEILSMKEAPDVYQYYQLFWKGFNHELNGEGQYKHSEEKEIIGRNEIFRENNLLEHKIVIKNKEGNHVSFCGLWYDQSVDFAYIEPLATWPEYRGIGLAKAAMFEGIKRVKELGAKKVIVGSSQTFYLNKGFKIYKTQTIWKN